jgi:hypothetical protein
MDLILDNSAGIRLECESVGRRCVLADLALKP